MGSVLEEKILKFLKPRSGKYAQDSGTKEALRDVFSLFDCMKTTKIPQVRQYCAFVLRKEIAKGNEWEKIPEDIKIRIKAGTLELFEYELKATVSELLDINVKSSHATEFDNSTEQTVLSAITKLISEMVKQDTNEEKWPELMILLHRFIESNDMKDKKVGLYAMSIISASATAYVKLYLKELLLLFSKHLDQTKAPKIQYFTIVCITNFVYLIGQEEKTIIKNLVPLVVKVVRNIIGSQEVHACKTMEVFDSFMWSKLGVIDPHIKLLINFWLELASNQNIELEVRIKSLRLVRWLIRLRKQSIVDLKLITPILKVLFPIMCERYENDDDDDINKEDGVSLRATASQGIGTMALRLPNDKFMPPLMFYIEAALSHENPQYRKAAYMTLAVITKNCAEYLKRNLEKYLQYVRQGINEKNLVARNAVVFCLGQFVEYLQPNISRFTSNLLPMVLDYLQTTCQLLKEDSQDLPSLSKAFYVLEKFCENLESELYPKLPKIIEHLVSFLDTPSFHAKQLSINAIRTIVSSGKGNFVELFPMVLSGFKAFVRKKCTHQLTENTTLRTAIAETLCMVAGVVGNKLISKQMAHECVYIGMILIDDANDSNLRRCVYDLFSAMSYILKNDIDLSTAVGHMIKSISDGECFVQCIAKTDSITLFEEVDPSKKKVDATRKVASSASDTDDDEEEDDDILYENPDKYEKYAAYYSIQEISANSPKAFLPQLEYCFTKIQELLDDSSVEIRREVIYTLGQFCIMLNQIYLETKDPKYLKEMEQKRNIYLPLLFTTAKKDKERHVAGMCLKSLLRMINKIKVNLFSNNTLEPTVALIKDVFRGRLTCQKYDDEEELGFPEFDYNHRMYEYSVEIVLSLVETVPWKKFKEHFYEILPLVISVTNSTRSVALKACYIGTLAEILSELEVGAAKIYVQDILSIFLTGMNNHDDEIRNDSVYGLGTLIENAKEDLYDFYPSLIQALVVMLDEEKYPYIQDNTCSTIAKIMTSNSSLISMEDVFPLFLQHLPLKVDMKENMNIYSCLTHLYNLQIKVVLDNVPKIIKILSEALAKQKLPDDTKLIIVNLVRAMFHHHPKAFDSLRSTLPKENFNAIYAAIRQKPPSPKVK